MGNNSAKYSILYFSDNINDQFLKKIIGNIVNGIKVIVVSNEDFTSSINKNEILKKVYNNSMLQVVIDKELNIENTEEFIDGNLTKEIKAKLTATSFNLNQFLIEHNKLDRNIIVKAGAGSGKTKTMIDRIMYLKHMDDELNFSQVAMITFTNEATNEMKSRLSKKVSDYYSITKNPKYLHWLQELNYISVDTIHRFAKKIISLNTEAIGLSSNFTISDFRYRKKKILETLIHKYNQDHNENYLKIKHIPQYLVVNAILKTLDYFDNKAVEISDEVIIDLGNEQFSHMLNYLLRNLVKELNTIKIEEDKLETSDLIKKLRIISSGVVSNLNIDYKYIFVDEFQDTDLAQAEFIAWIMKQYSTKIFIVGDTKQSIYRFRGADYTAFESFIIKSKDINNNVDEFTLNINYRTNNDLIGKLNSLFSNLNNCVDKFNFNDDDLLKSFKQTEDPTTLVLNDLSTEEKLVGTMKEILKLKAKKDKVVGEKTSIAILTRSNAQVRDISEMLNNNNIYCNVEIEGDFFRHEAVIEFYALIKGLIYRNVSEATYGLLSSSYGRHTLNNIELLKNYSPEKSTLKTYLRNNGEAEDLLQNHYNTIDNKPVLIGLKEIIEEIKPHIVYGQRKYKKIQDKEDIEQLKSIKLAISDYEINLDYLLYLLNKNYENKYVTLYDIEEFLRINIATNNIESRKKIDNKVSLDAVNCMTVHKSKGLEFDIVIMPCTNTSFFNSSSDVDLIISEINSTEYKVGYSIEISKNTYKNELYSMLMPDEKEEVRGEETRLLYVGTTRAKEILLMHSPNIISNASKPSSWLNLIGQGWNK